MIQFYDHFKPDPEFPEDRMLWEIEKPFFKDWIVEFAPFDPDYHTYPISKRKPYPLEPSGASARVPDSQVGVFLFEWSDEAASLQQCGWEFFVENMNAIEKALINKLHSIQEKTLIELEEELEGEDDLRANWDRIESGLRLPASEALGQFYKFVGISLAGSGIDDCCFVGFEFQSGWDQDHGLEIVMHKDRILTCDGMTVLLSPGGSIVAGIKANQEYDFDPGDFRLP